MKDITLEQLESSIQLFNQSMDDCLYVFDLENDYYCISKHALTRYCLPNYHFYDATNKHKEFVYHDDIALLESEFEKIKSGLIERHSILYRWLDHDKNPVWINCRGEVLLDDDGKPRFLVGCINEIGKKQTADNISGLLREPALASYMMTKNIEDIDNGFFMEIAIDDYEEINSRLGIKEGESILKAFSITMKDCLKGNQNVYELGNGRFIIIGLINQSKYDALDLYQCLRRSVENLLIEQAYRMVFTVSAGIVEVNGSITKYDTIIKYLEYSINKAKTLGKNSFYIFNSDDYNDFVRERMIRRKLQDAVDHDFDGFYVCYQPIVNAYSKEIIGAEALMRFKFDNNGKEEQLSPMEFIPILEESGLIIPTGRWILQKAIKACKKRQSVIPGFKINVNLSHVQITKSSIFYDIINSLHEDDLLPSSLGIEITETGYIEDTYHYRNLWSNLKEAGITLILDDYGTGYSNAYHLSSLMPHCIKIDRNLTIKAINNDYERSILKYIMQMANSLDLNVCVEGIETVEEYNSILELEPNYIQGFLFGRPVIESEFDKLVDF